MKEWKARKYVNGRPVATKMFSTREEAEDFANEQNNKTLAGIYNAAEWVVQKTYKRSKV